jgi:hypothetical protein
MTGSITISMPSGWTITGWHGGSRNGNTWTVVLSQVTLNVAGPSGSNETMTATIKPALGKTSTRTYTLS